MVRFDAKKLISLGDAELHKNIKYRNDDPRAQHHADKAIRRYTLAIDAEPQNSVAFHNRGLAKLRADDLHGAIADFHAAHELDPKEAIVIRSLKEAKAKAGQVRKEKPAIALGCLTETIAA